jgi:diguanylate cyclase (GGDEF)-like protein
LSRLLHRASVAIGTIRGRILIAFLAMSVVTAALGLYAVQHIREAGDLASRTFDQSLMSVSYARAAQTDFAEMQGFFVRQLLARTDGERQALDGKIEALHTSLVEDLTIAGERSQSTRAAAAAARAQRIVLAWDAARAGLHDQPDTTAAWKAIEHQSDTVNQQIDLLVNYTAGDGFLYRQQAHAIVAANIRAVLLCTGLALLVSIAVAWLLARRIIGPVALASRVAGQIAQGELDGVIPPGNGDELGALLAAMDTMRNNLRDMMQREVAQRRSAQMRLADALESSPEGFVMVDETGRIALVNSPLADVLAVSPHLIEPGTPIAALAAALDIPALASDTIGTGARGQPNTNDARLADGRWLRVSRSATQEGGFVAVLSDITLLKQQEERLRAINNSLDAALENMSQGLCLYDGQGRLVVVNSRFNEIYHLPASDVRPGLSFDEVFRLKVSAGNYADRNSAELLVTPSHYAGCRPGGTALEELAHGRTIAIAHRPTAEGGWVATYEDVTERRYAEKQILFMARHDALTHLPNRTLFGERIDEALSQLTTRGGFAVLCLDLDRFKQVNDSLGHPAGDELLQRVAERLCGCVRDVDTVARLGGDEFAVIQTGIARDEEATDLAQRIVNLLSEPISIGGQLVSIGVSIGISIAPTDGTTASQLLKNADAALYRAKADGRGTWRCFEPAMDARLQMRHALELDLRRGLDEEQFDVHYQPLYDLAHDHVCGFEALLRWTHPTRGSIRPIDFIPVAEEIGLIVPLGEWVLRRACVEASRWPSHVKVAVNVSSAQVLSGRLVGAVTDALAASGLSPNRLELEITETVLLANNAATLDTLHTLRGMGVRFSMDDFGTGYSSLSYLRSFPFDKIKIDQAFVRELATESEAGIIVRAITGLGSSLGMRTTAEGVETAEQLARLRIEGCDEVQGYYFSRPVPSSAIPAVLQRWNRGAEAAAQATLWPVPAAAALPVRLVS